MTLPEDYPEESQAKSAWDLLNTLEDYLVDQRLTEEDGRRLLRKLLAVECVIKQQAAPPPPDF